MLCECVPVVTSKGALPEVVGNEGIIVSYFDIQSIYDAILRAREMDGMKLFPPERRQKELIDVIEAI